MDQASPARRLEDISAATHAENIPANRRRHIPLLDMEALSDASR